ncbi:MAG: hypothetical protein FJ025_03725 [Chloroflexi bacterium]|nr:hypothetical protein [Chloroflexota bacterium]
MNNSNKSQSRKIKIICAWCGKDMGEKEGWGIEGVSHGMCNECAADVQAKPEGISIKDSFKY